MRGLRIVWRGLTDTFEHLLPFMVGSIAWWVLVLIPLTIFFPIGVSLGSIVGDILIVFGAALAAAPATTILMMWTDPRRAIDRPDWREPVGWLRDHYRRALVVGLLVFAAIGILILNIFFYGDSESTFALLLPLWGFLLVIAVALGLTSVSALGATDASVRQSFRRGAFVLATAPFRTLLILLFLLLWVVIGTLTIVPLVLLVPAIIAATINRLVLTQLQIHIPDPLAPTPERVSERQTGKK